MVWHYVRMKPQVLLVAHARQRFAGGKVIFVRIKSVPHVSADGRLRWQWQYLQRAILEKV